MKARRLALACACATLVLGCGEDPVGPQPGDERSTAELTFLRFDPAFFSTIPLQGSFWAVRGETRRLEMRSEPGGGESGEKFLEFEIEEESLLRRPDGTFFQDGDSILVTVTVDPNRRFVFDFQPSGLVFDPDEPAELRLRYVLASADLNGDGVVDERDREFEEQMGIWQQESVNAPWRRLADVEVSAKELEADVVGFTGFALAN